MIATLYNDTDPFCAQWLRNLIAAGHISRGDVDDRDIRDLDAGDVAGYRRCHFFAGIGGWDRALQLAGWNGPVWTGSCPCQPLSSAGRRKGHADERHLWPAFYRLIAECRPATIFGEQVASKDGREWLAGVRADLENLGYACGAADLCAASVGAPHIRQRLFWVADASQQRRRQIGGGSLGDEVSNGRQPDGYHMVAGGFATSGLADAADQRRRERRDLAPSQGDRVREISRQGVGIGIAGGNRTVVGVGNADSRLADTDEGECGRQSDRQGRQRDRAQAGWDGSDGLAQSGGDAFWSAAEWLPCLDGKARRVEPGIHPLAARLPGDVGRLRAYGNAIVPQAAAQFIAAFIQTGAAAP